jgi:hypothetical protein
MPIDGEDIENLLIIMVLRKKLQKYIDPKKKDFHVSLFEWIKQILRWNFVG